MANRIINKYKKMANTIAMNKDISPDTVVKVLDFMELKMTESRRKPQVQVPKGGISIRKAARKYRLQSSTITRWMQKGLIPVLLRTDNWTYLDENTIQQLAETYKTAPGRGRRTIIKQLYNNEQ